MRDHEFGWDDLKSGVTCNTGQDKPADPIKLDKKRLRRTTREIKTRIAD